MSILITGGTGFIGLNLISRLQNNFENIYILYRNEEKLKLIENKNNLIFIKADLDNLENLKEYKNDITIVIHSAGVVQSKNKDDFKIINVDGTKNLLDFFADSKSLKKMIYISSLTASGPSDNLNDIKTEISKDFPITAYGKSKLESELVFELYNIPSVILRPSAVFGKYDKALFSLFDLANKGIYFQIGKKDRFLSLCLVDDLIEVIYKALESDIIGKYLVSSYQPISYKELNKLLEKTTQKKFISLKINEKIINLFAFINENLSGFLPITSVFDKDKAKDILAPNWICSNKLISEKLNYKFNRNLETDLKETYDWYKTKSWIK